jgi:FtsP/CotA-like multicopper oxidase with cupredoxin domain
MANLGSRCIPAEALDAVLGGGGDADVWPEGVFYGCVPTKGSIEKIPVKSKPGKEGQWVAIDIIGAINFITTVVSIDEHDMWVYAMDGSYIEPQKVQALVMTNGDRYSVLVHTSKPGDYKIRVHANSAPQIITGHALLSIKGLKGGDSSESKAHIDLVGNPINEDVVLFNHQKASPFPPEPIPEKANALFRLDMFADGASYLWAMNSSRLMPSDLEHRNPPTLFSPQPYISNNVTITTKNNTWIDLVFFAAAFPMPPHPIHKHGNKMYEIGRGLGGFNWTSVEEAMEDIPESFNLVDPPRRDGFASPEAAESTAWVVVRYHVTNPGPWLLHCHVNNHMIGGMMVVIQDGVDVWPEVPDEYQLPYGTKRDTTR